MKDGWLGVWMMAAAVYPGGLSCVTAAAADCASDQPGLMRNNRTEVQDALGLCLGTLLILRVRTTALTVHRERCKLVP